MNFISVLLLQLLFTNQVYADGPDCVYTGQGNVYDFNGNYLPEKSFSLYLERYVQGPGQFSFVE